MSDAQSQLAAFDLACRNQDQAKQLVQQLLTMIAAEQKAREESDATWQKTLDAKDQELALAQAQTRLAEERASAAEAKLTETPPPQT